MNDEAVRVRITPVFLVTVLASSWSFLTAVQFAFPGGRDLGENVESIEKHKCCIPRMERRKLHARLNYLIVLKLEENASVTTSICKRIKKHMDDLLTSKSGYRCNDGTLKCDHKPQETFRRSAVRLSSSV